MNTTEVSKIIKNPISIVAFENTVANLSCLANASNSSGIRYQWKRVNGELVNGVNTPTLTIPSVTQADEDEYYCTASYGEYVNGTSHVAESNKAMITVLGKYEIYSYT